MGCFDGVSVAGRIADFEGPVLVQSCVNSECGTVKAFAANNYIGYEIATASSHTTFSFGESTASGRSVSADVSLKTEPHEGDHYVLKVRDAQQGTVLGVVDATVQYSTYCPNGCECGPACARATLEMAAP